MNSWDCLLHKIAEYLYLLSDAERAQLEVATGVREYETAFGTLHIIMPIVLKEE